MALEAASGTREPARISAESNRDAARARRAGAVAKREIGRLGG